MSVEFVQFVFDPFKTIIEALIHLQMFAPRHDFLIVAFGQFLKPPIHI